MECEKKCDSLEDIIKNIHENECGGWICCDENRKRMKKGTQRRTNAQ